MFRATSEHMWITARVLAASLGFGNKKAGCALLPSGLALKPPLAGTTSRPGLHALLILAVWWADGCLNNVTVEAGFEFWPAPPQWLLTLEGGFPSMGPSFLLYKMGRTIVPILEGSSEGEMREDGSRHMGGAQTMSPAGDVITVVTWPQDVGPHHRRPFLLGQQRDCHCLPDIPAASGSGQTIGLLFSRLQALRAHKVPSYHTRGLAGKGITQLQGLNRHKNSSQPGEAAQTEFLPTRHRLGQEGPSGARIRPCTRRLYQGQ